METFNITCPKNHTIEYKCVPKKVSPKKVTPKKKTLTLKKREPVKRKRCPNGTRKNPITGECEPKDGVKPKLSIKTKAVKTERKLTLKKPTKVLTVKKPTVTKTRKKLTIRKPVSKTVPAVKSAKQDIVESTTPKLNKDLREDYVKKLSKAKSYSPEMKKYLIEDITTKTKRKDLFECEKIDQVKIKQKGGTYKCVGVKTKGGIVELLKMLHRERDPSCITGPRQEWSNCWFNTMLMSMFVSDKGFKFMKPIRQTMITGRRFDMSPLPSKAHKAFLLLNNAIQASIDCNTNFDLLLHTNEIIKKIFKSVKDEAKKPEKLYKIKQRGNPVEYYKNLFHYLMKDSYDIDLFIQKKTIYMTSDFTKIMKSTDKLPEILACEIYDKESPNIIIPKTLDTKQGKYVLDSAIIRNKKQHHFASCLNVNGTQYIYDGMTFSRLTKYDWINKLNSEHSFSFKDIDSAVGQKLTFYFKKGYSLLFYYKV